MRLVTESALSKLLNISIRTLQSQRSTGTGFPFYKVGKIVRYDLDVVEKQLQENHYKSTSEFRNKILPNKISVKQNRVPSNRYKMRNRFSKKDEYS